LFDFRKQTTDAIDKIECVDGDGALQQMFKCLGPCNGQTDIGQHVRTAQEASEMTIPIRLAEQFFLGGRGRFI
jgi:hypothetical protein